MKKRVTTILLLVVFLVGLSVLLYPTVSEYVNSKTQSRAILQYDSEVQTLDNETYAAIMNEARQYNERLLSKSNRFVLSDDEQKEYRSQLSISESNSVIGYLEIPSIDVNLPVYHGTDDAVLQIGIGHIAGTSLPVGGESTHTVLSGHRALPSATLLSHLDQVALGDVFSVLVLDEVMVYEVDQIQIVDPNDFTALAIEPGADLVTLVTCTPYAINTHRLLVRGHRIDGPQAASKVRVTADALPIDTTIVAILVAVPILLMLLIYFFVRHQFRKRRG